MKSQKKLCCLFLSFFMAPPVWAFTKLDCHSKLTNWSLYKDDKLENPFLDGKAKKNKAEISAADAQRMVLRNENTVRMGTLEVDAAGVALFTLSKPATNARYIVAVNQKEKSFEVEMSEQDGKNKQSFTCELK